MRMGNDQPVDLLYVDLTSAQRADEVIPSVLAKVRLEDPAVNQGAAGVIHQHIRVDTLQTLEGQRKDQAKDPGGRFALAMFDHVGT
jgi:hypothetical protein